VSIVMLDFPEPETPVTTTNWFLGMRKSTFRKLLVLAPLMTMCCGSTMSSSASVAAEDAARVAFAMLKLFERANF
jgi:hypothetical protein